MGGELRAIDKPMIVDSDILIAAAAQWPAM
jgi:hypothetical protein